jgi:hypothetical protein
VISEDVCHSHSLRTATSELFRRQVSVHSQEPGLLLGVGAELVDVAHLPSGAMGFTIMPRVSWLAGSL